MKDKPTPCLAPLLSIAVQPKGRLRPCCWWWGTESEEDTHNIQTMSFQEYRNTVLKKYHAMMEKNEYPAGCTKCSTTANSRYESYNQAYPHLVGKTWNEVKNFKHLDLRFGNLCNASCVTCNYKNSSYFGKVEEQGYYMAPGQMPPTKESRSRLDQSMTWHEDPKIIEGIIESLEDVDYIYATGGEPTINPTLHKVMQHLIDENRAHKTTLEINTNGTNANQKFLDMYAQFKKITMFSMDAIGDLNDAMRFPTKFVQMEKNYQKYKDITTHQDRLMITPTVNIHNWFNMPDMFRWINENNSAIGGRLNILSAPVWQSISRMPQEYLNIGYQDMLDVKTVLTTNGRKLTTEYIVTDIKRRLANTAIYKKPMLDDENESWDKSLDITRKWFESRGYSPALTKIPELLDI